MSATLAVRHSVADYAAWRVVYDEAETIRKAHGCTGQEVFRNPDDRNDVFVTHEFPTVDDARAFAADPALAEGMQRAGVVSAPRIEIYEVV